MHRIKLLEDVKETLLQREKEHGNPHTTFYNIAKAWNMLPHEVCMLLVDLKIERWRSNQANKDNYRDAIGYLALAFELMTDVDNFGQTLKSNGRGVLNCNELLEEKETAN